MGQRYITGLTGSGGKADPDKCTGHLIKPGCFGINGDIARLMRPRDPPMQGIEIGYMLILIRGNGRPSGSVRRSLRRFRNSRGLAPKALGNSSGQGAKLHACQKIKELLIIGGAHLKIVERKGQIHLLIKRHELFR